LAVAAELIEGFGQMNADTPLLLKEAVVKLGQVSKENPDRGAMVSVLPVFFFSNTRFIMFKSAFK